MKDEFLHLIDIMIKDVKLSDSLKKELLTLWILKLREYILLRGKDYEQIPDVIKYMETLKLSYKMKLRNNTTEPFEPGDKVL